MKQVILIVIGVAIGTIFSAFARADEEPAEGKAAASQANVPAEEGTWKKYTLGLFTSYDVGLSSNGSASPGLGLLFSYKLAPQSELGLQFDHREHRTSVVPLRYTEVSLVYKHWLSIGRSWNPYLQAGAGWAWSRVNWEPAEVINFNNFTYQLGGGVRHALTKELGLDFGLQLHSVNSPLSLSRGKFIVGKAGVDVVF